MMYGLDDSSIQIIMSCISSVTSSVPVDGIPTDSCVPIF